MKRIVFSLILLLISLYNINAQDKTTRPSPPAQATAIVGTKTITIDYSQPSVKGRTIWGELVPYDKVWRAGANETTSFSVSDDVSVESKLLPAGKYAFFVIPTQTEWIIIFNKSIKWGAFSYKQEEDVLRVNVPFKKAKNFAEKLTYEISNKGVVTLHWENLMASFKVK